MGVWIISFSICFLLMYRKMAYFSKLILYSETLMEFLTISKSFHVKFLWYNMHSIISSTDRVVWLSFSYLYPSNFLLLHYYSASALNTILTRRGDNYPYFSEEKNLKFRKSSGMSKIKVIFSFLKTHRGWVMKLHSYCLLIEFYFLSISSLYIILPKLQ